MYKFWIQLLMFIENCEDRSSTEANIADFIIKNAAHFPRMSIFEVAEKCHTSPATVTRFCQKLHVGFKELKEACVDYNEFIDGELDVEELESNDFIFDANYYYEQIIQSLRETQQLFDQENIERALDYIEKADKVAFFGASYSNMIGKNAHMKFSRLKKYCSSFGRVENQLIEAELLGVNDIAIILSFSCSTNHILQVMKILKAKKNNIILLTANPQHPIASNANVILRVSSLQNQHFGSPIIQEYAMSSVMNHLYIQYGKRLLHKRK